MSTQKKPYPIKLSQQSSLIGKTNRLALANVTNQRHGPQNGSSSTNLVPPCPTKFVNSDKGTSACSASADLSVSVGGTLTTCDSLKRQEVEYISDSDMAAGDSKKRKTCNNPYISEDVETSGNFCKRDILAAKKASGKIVDVGNVGKNLMDLQLCAPGPRDIYRHLRALEVKTRPSIDFMENMQKDITPNMRAILVDWLVEVVEEYNLLPDTLYLAVNYIDRYLSSNIVNKNQLQLLGVACMMIACKQEEIIPPQVEEFCHATDNAYVKDEVLHMESTVMKFFNFEMVAATIKSFLWRFVNPARTVDKAPPLQLESLCNYLAELALLDYNMLTYAPSLIAASAIFLAIFILFPARRPWDYPMRKHTMYKPSDLCKCVKALHRLFCNSYKSSLPAVREKYSHDRFKAVANFRCPMEIPERYFLDKSCYMLV